MPGTMFLSVRDKMLYAIANDEGWDGDVGAPTGAFAAIWLDSKEINLIAAATDVEYDSVPKYWIVSEDSDGNLYFDDFSNPYDHKERHKSLMAQYVRWDND